MTSTKEQLAGALAEMLIEVIVERSVRAFVDSAEKYGIAKSDIPAQYLEAVETGASVGAAQTMLVLKEMGFLASE